MLKSPSEGDSDETSEVRGYQLYVKFCRRKSKASVLSTESIFLGRHDQHGPPNLNLNDRTNRKATYQNEIQYNCLQNTFSKKQHGLPH